MFEAKQILKIAHQNDFGCFTLFFFLPPPLLFYFKYCFVQLGNNTSKLALALYHRNYLNTVNHM